MGGSPSKPRDRNADLCDRRCSRWTALAKPNKLGTRHGTLVLLLSSTPFRAVVDCIVVAPLVPWFSLISVRNRSWIRGARFWHNAMIFLMRNRPSALRTSTWMACGRLGYRCRSISREERTYTPRCRSILGHGKSAIIRSTNGVTCDPDKPFSVQCFAFLSPNLDLVGADPVYATLVVLKTVECPDRLSTILCFPKRLTG